MSSGAITAIAICGMMAVIAVATSMAEVKSRAKRKEAPPEPSPAFTSLSLLAGLSFFSGLGAILLATVASILSLTVTMGEVIPMTDSSRRQVDLAAKIVLYCSLLPAVGAAAFGLASRGVISESRGAVRGRPLYRTGLLLAVITAVVVFNAKLLNPTTWLEADEGEAASSPSDIDRGYLGVELGPLTDTGSVRVLRVVPGSPADRAGLKSGEEVVKVDGRPVYQLDPAFRSGFSPGSSVPYVGTYIGTLRPGSRITLAVRRGSGTIDVIAELSASFGSLLKLVKDQSHDDERLAVLKAAGSARRYSADELRRICATFNFDEDRLKVIEASLPLLQDPQNAYQVLGSLDFGDSKQKVSGWIEALLKPK